MPSWLGQSLAILAICIILAWLTTGCSTAPTMSDGQPGIQLLPDMECKGKITLTATGSLNGGSGFGATASNHGTLQADCGEGFLLIHQPEKSK